MYHRDGLRSCGDHMGGLFPFPFMSLVLAQFMPEDDETFICPQCELRVRNTDPLQGYVSPVEYHISQSPNCPLALTLHDIPGFYPPLDFAVDGE